MTDGLSQTISKLRKNITSPEDIALIASKTRLLAKHYEQLGYDAILKPAFSRMNERAMPSRPSDEAKRLVVDALIAHNPDATIDSVPFGEPR